MTQETITVYGITAAEVEIALHDSFYGIFGNTTSSRIARRDCYEAVRKHLKSNGTDYNWFIIDTAESVNTDGTPTPYQAEITYSYE